LRRIGHRHRRPRQCRRHPVPPREEPAARPRHDRQFPRVASLTALADWKDFFGAQLGASATLAGLIFVGVSLNLTRILAAAFLPLRALLALGLLVAILVVASLLLVPGQGLPAIATQI